MPGTKDGGKRAAATAAARYSEEARREWSARGGRKISGRGSKGFGAISPALHKKLSSRGGMAKRKPQA